MGPLVENKSSSPAWAIRLYEPGDLPAVMEIVRARAAAYNPELLLGVDAVLWRLQGPPGSEPRPAIVVTGPPLDGVPEGALLGAGSFSVEGSEEGEHSYVLHFWGHPTAVELGVEHALVDRLLDMVRDYEAGLGSPVPGDVRVFSSYGSKVPGRKELFESIGMTFVRLFLRMERSLHEPIDEPAGVHGVTLRTYRRPEDNAGACAAYNDSFSDHFDHHDEDLRDWNRGIADPSRRPDLSWLAEIDGKPGEFAGFCICGIYDDANREKGVREGWIELLGTTREWRGRGLGRSLLLHGLQSLKSAGFDTALLGVDSESSTGANLLYEKVGFRERQREYVYSATLAET
jgi:mycothiol synthase